MEKIEALIDKNAIALPPELAKTSANSIAIIVGSPHDHEEFTEFDEG